MPRCGKVIQTREKFEGSARVSPVVIAYNQPWNLSEDATKTLLA